MVSFLPAPPFPLRDYLKENKVKIQKLNMRVAYQRPCASRYTPEKDYLIGEIFELIGVERVKRNYDGVNAICCGLEVGGPGVKLFPRGKNFGAFQDKNLEDAKNHGAEAIVYLCTMSFVTLNKKTREAGMKNYLISDICRLALKEKLPENKPI